MASAGAFTDQIVEVHDRDDAVRNSIVSFATGVPDYTVATSADGAIALTRRYRPDWTIVVAVLSVPTVWIGLLALFYKKTETLFVTLSTDGDGTRVVISGVASVGMLARLDLAKHDMNAIEIGVHHRT